MFQDYQNNQDGKYNDLDVANVRVALAISNKLIEIQSMLLKEVIFHLKVKRLRPSLIIHI